MKRAGLLGLLVLGACGSHASPPAGRVLVALTVDWEGIELTPESFQALDELRGKLGPGPVPITHFVSAAYATKPRASPDVMAAVASGVHPGDELAVHLHAWQSLALAAGIEPHTAPSFLSGTDELLRIPGHDDDVGFDLDLDAYDVPAMRALLRTSREILARTHLPVSTSFRAGGYLATPKLLLALGDEGYAADSSAVDVGQLRAGLDSEALPQRLSELWPRVDTTTQPFMIRGGAMQPIVELPIAAVVDYVSVADLERLLDAARERARSDPEHDVFVVLACHFETAPDFLPQLADELAQRRSALTFVTIERAAEIARFALPPPSPSS